MLIQLTSPEESDIDLALGYMNFSQLHHVPTPLLCEFLLDISSILFLFSKTTLNMTGKSKKYGKVGTTSDAWIELGNFLDILW